MDGQNFLETLREDHGTELSRLGSSKGLYALTGGDMADQQVRAAAAGEAAAAARVFDVWVADESNDAAVATFGDAAETARDHLETFDVDPGEERSIYATLEDIDGTVERAGALLARALVTGKALDQTVGFFVGDADPQTADQFRGLRADIETQRDAAIDLLESLCDTDGDWAAARTAAESVVAAAYEEYVASLESMGIKPKNIC